ncbi:hypothetical protein DFJ73DRAFT_528078 [Zopfochytrium polystomum]|nr:hypothetical protein DFJ73DRAFT_528078 [Zopfochytrium polystomum]
MATASATTAIKSTTATTAITSTTIRSLTSSSPSSSSEWDLSSSESAVVSSLTAAVTHRAGLSPVDSLVRAAAPPSESSSSTTSASPLLHLTSLSSSLPTLSPAQQQPAASTRRWACETCRRRKLKCEGERPSCYYCSTRNIECIYVGARSRADVDAMKKQARSERLPPRRPHREKLPGTSSVWPVTATWKASSQSWFSNDATFQLPNLKIPLPLDVTNFVVPFRLRPGAPHCEELELIEEFFERATWMSGVIHRRTYLLRFLSLPPYLRYAVCAAGAGNLPYSDSCQDVADWYTEQAIAGLQIALKDPSFECMQALLILPPTPSCPPPGFHSEQLKKLAIYLDLHIDPDYLPALFGSSWAEKEARRRCWWHLFIADRTFSSGLCRTPALSRSMSTVKPACPEAIWLSSKPLDSFDASNSNPNLADSPVNWHVKLVEIFHRVARASLVANDTVPGDLHALCSTEDQLEAELLAWWNMVPSTFWNTIATEDQLYESMVDNPGSWQYCLDLYFLYHGTTCLLMRRRTLDYLRDLSSVITVSSFGDSREDVSEQLKNQAAFGVAIRSGETVAKLILMLNKTNAFVHRLHNLTIYFGLQAAMTLFIAQSALSDLPSRFDSENFGANSSAINTELPLMQEALNESSAVWATWIEAYLWLLKRMTGSRKITRLFARFCVKFADKIQQGDWTYLNSIDFDQSALLDDVGLIPKSSAAFAKQPLRHPADLSSNPYALPARLVGTTVRSFIQSLRVAKEIARSLTPPLPPLEEEELDLMHVNNSVPTSGANLMDFTAVDLPLMPEVGLFDDSSGETEHFSEARLGRGAVSETRCSSSTHVCATDRQSDAIGAAPTFGELAEEPVSGGLPRVDFAPLAEVNELLDWLMASQSHV